MKQWPQLIQDIIQMSKVINKDTRQKNWTYESLAEELNVSGATISRIVNDGVEPKHSIGESILSIHRKTERDFKRMPCNG